MVVLLVLTASALRAEPPSTPAMMYGDSDRLGRPFAKDPSVIRFDNRYLLYYSMAAYSKQLAPPGAPKGWAIGVAESADLVHWKKIGEILPRQPCERNGIPNGEPGDWNASETGHPGVFEDVDGRTYLFVQGNNDRGRTWFLSCYEIAWKNGLPVVVWDSPKFPMKRLVPSGRRQP
jgi:hypothetical protein